MGRYKACLIDVFETVVSCDFSAHNREMPALAGIEQEFWNAAFRDLAPHVMDGRLSMRDAYAAVVRRSGREPVPDRIETMVQRDKELLIESATLHDDVAPFLELLRQEGIATALVSNCAENTAPLLDALGLTGLVDTVVLSCDVRSAKPDAAIYQEALARLGANPADAMFVDDQVSYCDGAALLGISTFHLSRPPAGAGSGGDHETIQTLADLHGVL